MRRLVTAVVLALALSRTTTGAEPTTLPRTRADFARAISKLKKGMREDEVVRLLGMPDDLRTEYDAGGISTAGTKEIWRYGTSGHLTTATLGQVYINEQGKIQYISGQGQPAISALPEETELRRLLTILSQVPSYNDGECYNPRDVILAVNCLHPLGKEQALAVIDEFLRVSTGWGDEGQEGVFLVLRTLFDVPPDQGSHPRMYVGAPSLADPGKKLLPRFPVAIEGDIPFLLVSGYHLSGRPEQPESHLGYFREHGILRNKPLMPTNAPLEALERFLESPGWIFTDQSDRSDDHRGRHRLGNQLLRLLDTVYRAETGVYGGMLPFGDDEAKRRQEILSEVSNLRIGWDLTNNIYTYSDGTALPAREPKQYRREIWRLSVSGVAVELILERNDARHVNLWFDQWFEPRTSPQTTIFTLFDVLAKDTPIVQIRDYGRSRDGDIGGRMIDLKEGTQIQAELTIDDNRELSPVFKP